MKQTCCYIQKMFHTCDFVRPALVFSANIGQNMNDMTTAKNYNVSAMRITHIARCQYADIGLGYSALNK